jgi:KAP family P-loop domain
MNNFGDGPNPNPGAEFDIYATHLCDIAQEATDEAEGAFTIGIFGSWGSGKTTLMRCIEKKFFERPECKKYKTIWFNPWKYEGKEAVWNALIKTILIEMEEESKITQQVKQNCIELREKINLYGNAAFTQLPSALLNAWLEKYLGIKLGELKTEQLEALYSIDKQRYNSLNRFELDFKKLVDEYVDSDGKLIVFIDDLDRCLPENALNVLEAVKLYLDYEKCVFFIGVDKKIIEQGVRKRYLASLKITGKEYIEKMIQLDFYLPDKSPEELKNLLRARISNKWRDDQEMWDLLLEGTSHNIRKAKRFLHSFNLIERIAKPIGIREELYPKLGRLLLIQMNYPDFFLEFKREFSRKESRIFDKANEDFFTRFIDFPEHTKFQNDFELMRFIQETSAKRANISQRADLEVILKLLRINDNIL